MLQGNWTYSADNTQSAIQSLGEGDSLTDSFTVESVDGTSETITITLTGTNDAAVIGGVDTSDLTEDSSATLMANGTLTISDTDTDEALFASETVSGSYGSLTIDSAGNWNYSADSSQQAIQSLGHEETVSDTITVSAVDGTTHQIVISISGTNDAAVIGGITSATLAEDASATLTASGALTIADADTGEDAFTAETISGSYGSLTIDAAGNWTYSADNTQSAIQSLGEGDSLTDSFTVESVDGTSHSITVTIDGNNDAPVTASVDLGSTDEDTGIVITEAQLLANASDVDGDTLSISSLTLNDSAHGSVTDNGNGTWTFNPAANFSGNDIAFDFTVSDGFSGDEASGTATINITGVVDAPVLTSSQESLDEQVFSADKVGGWSTTGSHWNSSSGETMSIGTTASRMIDTSNDNVEFSFTLTAYGDFRIEWNGQVVGTVSHAGYSFQTATITLPDTNLSSTELKIVTINRQGSIKSSTLDVASTDVDAVEDTAVALDINAALSDTDGSESLQVELGNVPDGATLSDGVNSAMASGGTVDISSWNFSNITFTPPANESGNYELQITATSSEGGQQLSESLSIELNVAAVNDTATAISLDSLTVFENSDGAMVGNLATTDADTGDTHSYTVSDNRFEVVNDQLKLKDGISLDHETEPAINLSVTTTDQDNASFTENFSLSVTDANDAPIASAPVSEITNEDTAFTITGAELLANTSDADNNNLTVSNVRVTSGQVSVVDNGDSTWTVTPDSHWSGNGQLLFDISDGTAAITSQLDISVTPDADTPQLTIEGSSVVTSMNFDNGLESGWTSENEIETQSSGTFLGLSPTGSRIAELDAGETGNPDAYYYSVDTSQGHDHEISLWVKQRDNYDGTDEIEVAWNGQILQTIDPGTSWQEVTISLPDTGLASTQLAIREVAEQNNSLGPMLDSIEVIRIGADDSVDSAYDKELSSAEDTRIALDLSTSLADSDGSETIATSLNGIPSGFGLSDGSNNITTDGSAVDVSGWSLASLTLTPVANHETDFTLTVTTTATESTGGDTATNSQTIFIDVQPVQDVAMISGDDSGDITEDDASTLTVSGSLSVTDVDAGEDSFTAETVNGTYGSLTIDADGNWSYSADNSQSAIQSLADSETSTDVLTVQSLDGTTHNVAITINGTNDIVSSSDHLITLNEDGTHTFSTADFSFSDTDSSDSLQSITITQLPANGELKLGGAAVSASDTIAAADIGNLTFSPADNDNGSGYASVQFMVSDGIANSSSQTLTFDVTAVNDPPTAPAPEIDQFDFIWGGGSMNDKVADTYTLPSGFSFGDSVWVHRSDDVFRKAVQVEISDNSDGTLSFKAIDAAYTTLSNWNSLTAEQQETFFENGSGTSQSVATSNLESGYAISNVAIHGGTPVPGFLDSVTGVDIHPFFVAENGLDNVVVGTVASTDLEGDVLTYSLSDNAGGRFAINSSTGEITVANSRLLDFETAGAHTVTVEVSDGSLTSSRDYSIYIQDTNDAPELLSSLDNQTTAEEAAFIYTLPASAFGDQDNDTITYSASLANDDPLPAWLSFDPIARTFSGTPDDPDIGSISVKITLSDGVANTDVFWSLEVTAVNDAPIAANDSNTGKATAEGSAISGSSSVLTNDTDVENDPLTVVDVNGTAISGLTSIAGDFGELSIGSDGNWTYTPTNLDLSSDLIAHWTFDETSGTIATDSAPSGSENDEGILKEGAAFVSSGLNGNAVEFDGASAIVDIQDSNDLNIYSGDKSERTINFAFKIDSDNDLSGRQILYEEGGGGKGYNIYIDNGTLYVGAWASVNNWDNGTFLTKDISSLSGADWHQVSMVLDAGNNSVKAFFDGEEFGSGHAEALGEHGDEAAFGNISLHYNANTGEYERGGSRFHDGTVDSSEDYSFNGFIDEARIYDRALNNQELNALKYEFETGTLQDVFTYTVSDSELSDTATLTIDVNRTPKALSGTLSATEDGGDIVGQLSAIDFDAGDTLTFSVESQPSEGSVTINIDGSYSFNPGADFQDLASGATRDVTFDYRVTDAQGDFSTETVTVTVTGVNDVLGLSSHALISEVTAAFDFDDTNDNTGNGNNLTLSGSATTTGTGYGGSDSAFEMDGTEGHGDIAGLETGGAMSVSTWVKFDSFNQSWSRIFDFGNGRAYDNIVIGHISTTNDLGFHIFQGQGSPADAELNISNFFTAGEWVHVTATIGSDGTMSIYKNGELAGQTAGVVPSTMVRTNNYIGKSNWDYDGKLDGSVDEFAVYNKELSAGEIKAIYEAGSIDNLLGDALYIEESSANSTVVGTVSAINVDNENLTYSLNNDAGGRFTIDSATGEISVADSALLDHDSNASHTVTVQVSDGTVSSTRDYTVYVTDIDETVTGDDAGAVSVNLDSSFISQASQITLPAATGLKGEFYETSTEFDTLSEAVALVNNTTPKANFIASSLNYAKTDGTLAGFLGSDGNSLSGHGNSSDETFALKLTGYIRLSAGTHVFKVTSDDGFSLKINNQTVTEFTTIRAAADSSGNYTAPQDGLYEVELIYWQNTGGADMNITSSSGDMEFYDVLPAGAVLVDGQTYYNLPTPDITVDVTDGVTLSAGTNNGDGTWTLKEPDLSGLTMTSSDKSWDDSLTFSMTKDTKRTISIGDSSFESVGVQSNGGVVQQPGDSAWSFSSSSDGIHDYDSSSFKDQSADDIGSEDVPDGYNAAFINTDGGIISQTLSETFDRSTSYQLQVDIGNPLNPAGVGYYEVRLKAGGVTLVSDGSLTPAEGEFETLTINLDGSTIASDSAAIGQSITIELVKNSGYQVAFDNVRMTATTTEQITQETINTDQSNQIIGGKGNDILTGGHDSDIFIWHAGDDGTAVSPVEDTITDFHVGQGGDVLDLSDMLVDEQSHQLDEYLHFNFDNGDTTMEISSQANGDVTQKITLQGVDLSGLGGSDSEIINNLLNDGNLQIDN